MSLCFMMSKDVPVVFYPLFVFSNGSSGVWKTHVGTFLFGNDGGYFLFLSMGQKMHELSN